MMQEEVKNYRFPSSAYPPVKAPLTPEEAEQARAIGSVIAEGISHIAKTKYAFLNGITDKAKNLFKANLNDIAKELNANLVKAHHKLENEAALAKGSLVEMPELFNLDLLQYGQQDIRSQYFDENGLLNIYQTELNELLNTDFSKYLPKVDEPKVVEIDNSRSPRIHVNPDPVAYRDIEGENDAVHRVAAGYLARKATHSVGYSAGFLFNTDFTSTQEASMASGGVRPGAIQLDPNPKPNEYLQANFQFGSYVSPLGLSIARAKQNFLNTAALGSLASGSVQQVYIDPILLDLTGQGVRMTPYTNQGVLFDMDYSGTLRRTGWVDTKTGILVDSKGTDKVKNVSQMFSEYYGAQPGQKGASATQTFKDGYEALRSVDSDKNSVIDPQDPIWPNLKVWVDANHNGESEEGELKTLDSLGISQISLETKPATLNEMRDGNGVRAYGRFIINGIEREALSVDFIADPTSTTIRPWGEGNIVISQATSKINKNFGAYNVKVTDLTPIQTYVSSSEKGEILDATTLGVDHIYGGSGNDQLIASEKGSWLVGGGGSNIYQGGVGDDVFVISASDDPTNIHGGEGTNTAIIVGKSEVLLNMYEAQIHIAQGGPGDNVIISGGGTGVYIKGGSGTNTLIGGAGDDVIVGGSGHNFIVGGSGKALIYAGPNGDTIYGAEGDSIIHAGGGDDHILAGPGNDVVEVGSGNAQIDGGAGTNIVQFHGSYADYHIERTEQSYIITDKIPKRDGKVTLRNIQKCGFSDLSVMDLAPPIVIPVSDSLKTNAQGQPFDRVNLHRITAAQLLANDQIIVDKVIHPQVTDDQIKVIRDQMIDQSIEQWISNHPRLRSINRAHMEIGKVEDNGNILVFISTQVEIFSAQMPLPRVEIAPPKEEGVKITEVGEAVGGQVALTPEGDVLFTPDSQFAGMMQFKYKIADSRYEMEVIDLAKGERAPIRAVVSLLTSDIPSDPLVTQQWYLNDANIFPVWRDYTGKGVHIGQFEPPSEFAIGPEILNYEHPDLAANVDSVWLADQKAKGVLPSAFSNHATMVAGVMVAAKNGVGIVGVAPNAKIVGYALDNRGADIKALGHMAEFDIAHHSWSFQPDFVWGNLDSSFFSIRNVLLPLASYAAANGRGGLGTVIVCSSGNEREKGGSAQGSFANNNRFSIQVGAINAAGDLSTLQIKRAAFSNPGTSILVSAPGSNIVSTSQMLRTDQGSVFGQEIGETQGTSFAAPIVSGVVALMLEANPHLGYRDVQHILLLSARRVNDNTTVWRDSHAHQWNGGAMHVSHDYGFGAVDARAAVRLTETWLGKNTAENEFVFSGEEKNIEPWQNGKLTSKITIPAGLQIEHVEIDLDLSYSDLSDLVVKLVSPTNTESILLNRHGINPADLSKGVQTDLSSAEPGRLHYRFMTTHDWGEGSRGEWTLEVTDVKAGSTTTLHNWALNLYGNKQGIDDTYFYTDEYAELVKANPQRAVLDDAINGSPGGRNTIHAAAVSSDVNVNLLTGQASINGQPLTIHRPEEIQNIITGDGNDMLVANSAGAVLDGGRGHNTLMGGSGVDIFVAHQRENGSDTLLNFDPKNGDKIHLVGFSSMTKEALEFSVEGQDVHVQLQTGQRIVLKNQTADLNEIKQAFVMQTTLYLPGAYLFSNSDMKAVTEDSELVILSGGEWGITLKPGSSNSLNDLRWALAGKVYEHNRATMNKFVIAPKDEENDPSSRDKRKTGYGNALRGFKSEVDQIDLRALGIKSFEDLTIEKAELGVINGVAAIQGTEILSRSLGNEEGPVSLLYLDAIDPSQIKQSHFLFAIDMPKPVEKISLADWQRQAEANADVLIQQMAMAKESGILPPDSGAPGSDPTRLDLAAGNDAPQLLKKPDAA